MSDTAPAAEPVEDTRTIHQRLAAVLGDLPAIGKDDRAPSNMGGYAFRGIESITGALKPLLARHGVFVTPTTIERVPLEPRQTKGGGLLFLVDVHVRWTFYGLMGDSLECSTWGEGSDSGDKAVQKSYTAAFKAMLAEVFCIADSETDAERHDVPTAENYDAPPGAAGHPTEWPTKDDIDKVVDAIKARPELVREAVKARMAQAGIKFDGIGWAELGTVEAWEALLADDATERVFTKATPEAPTAHQEPTPDAAATDGAQEPPVATQPTPAPKPRNLGALSEATTLVLGGDGEPGMSPEEIVSQLSTRGANTEGTPDELSHRLVLLISAEAPAQL